MNGRHVFQAWGRSGGQGEIPKGHRTSSRGS